MPPSRCCTLLRLVSTLTKPLATTAPFKGAVIAQAPKPPKKMAMIDQPAIAAERMESFTPCVPPRAACAVDALGIWTRRFRCASAASIAMVSAVVPSGDGPLLPVMLRMFSMTLSRLRCGAAGHRLNRRQAGQAGDHVIAWSECFSRAILQDQQLVSHTQRIRAVRDDDHRGAPLFELGDAGEQ